MKAYLIWRNPRNTAAGAILVFVNFDGPGTVIRVHLDARHARFLAVLNRHYFDVPGDDGGPPYIPLDQIVKELNGGSRSYVPAANTVRAYSARVNRRLNEATPKGNIPPRIHESARGKGYRLLIPLIEVVLGGAKSDMAPTFANGLEINVAHDRIRKVSERGLIAAKVDPADKRNAFIVVRPIGHEGAPWRIHTVKYENDEVSAICSFGKGSDGIDRQFGVALMVTDQDCKDGEQVSQLPGQSLYSEAAIVLRAV